MSPKTSTPWTEIFVLRNNFHNSNKSSLKNVAEVLTPVADQDIVSTVKPV